MSKPKTKLGILGLCVVFFFTGCADKGTLGELASETDNSNYSVTSELSNTNSDIVLSSISEVRECFDIEAEKIKLRTFDNIIFENAFFSFTETDEVSVFEYESEINNFIWLPDDAYDYLCKQTEIFFPEMYSDEDKSHEIRFGDAEKVNNTEAGIYRYPTLKQYKEMNLITENPIPIIANSECYIEVFGGALRGYEQGDLAKLSGYDGRLDYFDTLANFKTVYRTENLESEKMFHLVSGDITIAEAVRATNKSLSELNLSTRNIPIKPSVQSVSVIDIGDGCFAFYFAITAEYNQIKFNAFEPDESMFYVTTVSDSTNEIELFGEAVMFDINKITRYRMISPFVYSDVKKTKSYNSVLSLEDAAEIVSRHLTDGIEFKTLSVSPVYKEFSDKTSNQYLKDEDYMHRKITVKPCWRFVLKPITGATNRLYYVFVDMLSGTAYTSVQLMESSVEYD